MGQETPQSPPKCTLQRWDKDGECTSESVVGGRMDAIRRILSDPTCTGLLCEPVLSLAASLAKKCGMYKSMQMIAQAIRDGDAKALVLEIDGNPTACVGLTRKFMEKIFNEEGN